GYELGSLEIGKKTSVNDLVDFIKDFNGVKASFNSGTGKVTIESDVSLTLKSNNKNFNASAFTADTDGVNVVAQQESGFASDEAINKVIDRLNNALSNLRSQASEFGTNLSTVEIRQDYTKKMINTLQEGAGKLTLADTNQEGANLLALQTRQQLGSTSLSFASQADQTVLSLF
ncbi:MAG: flagellin, partial [Pannonibacter sp.]